MLQEPLSHQSLLTAATRVQFLKVLAALRRPKEQSHFPAPISYKAPDVPDAAFSTPP